MSDLLNRRVLVRSDLYRLSCPLQRRWIRMRPSRVHDTLRRLGMATCATFSAGLSPERINTVWMRTDKVHWDTLHYYPRERDDCSWTFDTPKATFTSRNCYGFDATITVDARSGYPLKTKGYILAVQRPLKLILQLILSLTFSIHVWLLRQSTAIHTSSPKTAMPSEAMPAIHAVLRQLK